MASDPEARTQLARLLGLEPATLEDRGVIATAVDHGMDRLTDGLLAEAAASDDVSDRDSALDFINRRLDYLGALLDVEQRSRLLHSLQGKIDLW